MKPEERLGRVCDHIEATLDRCIRTLRQCIWLMGVTLVLMLLIAWRVWVL